MADRSRRREEAEVFTEMRGLVFRLLTSAATLSFALGSSLEFGVWSLIQEFAIKRWRISAVQPKESLVIVECYRHRAGGIWDILVGPGGVRRGLERGGSNPAEHHEPGLNRGLQRRGHHAYGRFLAVDCTVCVTHQD